MKTALCLSGHLRTFRDTFQSLKDNVIDPLQCDVFIHTWDMLSAIPNGKTPGDANFRHLRTVDVLPQIYDLYNPAFMQIEEEDSKLKEFKQLTQDIVIRPNEIQFIINHVGMHVHMFYTMYMANMLRIEYEQENKVKYDLIIRCRPDMFFRTKLNHNMFHDKQSLYIPDIGTYFDGGCNDQFAAGSPDLMNKYCDVYNHVAHYYRHRLCVPRPEAMISFHLKRLHVPVTISNIEYDLYRLDNRILRQHRLFAEFIGNFK